MFANNISFMREDGMNSLPYASEVNLRADSEILIVLRQCPKAVHPFDKCYDRQRLESQRAGRKVLTKCCSTAKKGYSTTFSVAVEDPAEQFAGKRRESQSDDS
jgi:hypothetical protein